MNMIISGVAVNKEGKNVAYVAFEDGDRYCEIRIPDCVEVVNKGYTPDEMLQLIDYTKANLTMLKKEAAKNNPLAAMMKDKK